MPQFPPDRATHSAEHGAAIVAGTPFPPCRAVLAGTGGAATVTFRSGSTATVVLTAGYNPISITNVSASGLTAANLTALY